MAKSIQERIRAQIAKQDATRKKAEQAKTNRSFAARVAADVRRERGIDRALETGIARNKHERRALDMEYEVLPPEWEGL